MQRHTEVGERILQGIDDEEQGNDFIQMSRDIVKYHHESWDGSGYPTGIAGEEIPLSAQIVNIVTAYCALTEDRSYRSAFSKEKAVEILGEEAGVKFNPALYDVWLDPCGEYAGTRFHVLLSDLGRDTTE